MKPDALERNVERLVRSGADSLTPERLERLQRDFLAALQPQAPVVEAPASWKAMLTRTISIAAALLVCLTILALIVAPTTDRGPASRQADPITPSGMTRLGSDRFRPSGLMNVSNVVFSPDSKTLAVATREGTIHLFDSADGRRLGTLPGGTEITFSEDGRFVRSLSTMSVSSVEVLEWDRETGKARGSVELAPVRNNREGRGFNFGVLSPGGKVAALAYSDASVEIWDAAKGKLSFTLNASGSLYRLAFSPDGSLLVTGSSDKKLRVFDVATGLPKVEVAAGAIVSVEFSSDGRSLIWGAHDQKRAFVRLRSLATGREDTLELGAMEQSANTLACAPDGKSLAVAGWNGLVRAFDVATKRELFAVPHAGPQGFGFALSYSPDGRRLAGGSRSGVEVWDAATGKSALPDSGHRTSVLAVGFSPDGLTLRSWGREAVLREWDLREGKETRRTPGDVQMVHSSTFSRGGDLLTGDGGGNLSLRDAQGVERRRLKLPNRTVVTALAFSPTGKTFASANFGTGTSSRIRVWDAVRLEDLVASNDEQPTLLCLAFSPDGQLLATGGTDGKVRLLDAVTLQAQRVFNGCGNVVTALAFSPDGLLLATAGGDRNLRWSSISGVEGPSTVCVWDVSSAKEVSRMEGPKEGISSLSFAPDRCVLAGGGCDRIVRIWEVPGGKELSRLEGHSDEVLCLAYSPDGKTLASGSADTTILLWKFPPSGPTAKTETRGLEEIWEDLGGPAGFLATEQLAGTGRDSEEVVRFLRKKLELSKSEAAAKLIVRLDHEDIQVRGEATRELTRLGVAAASDLRAAADRSSNAEVSARAGELLGRIERVQLQSPDIVRRSRVIAALARLGAAPARDLLRELAERSPFEGERLRAKQALDQAEQRRR